MTNVPSLTFTNSGLTIPSEAAILSGVQQDQNAAFGVTLNPSLSTPQGQLASTLSAIIADKNAQIASVMNNLDPNFSSGRWQDALGKIYGLTRIQGAGTVVSATLTGSNFGSIPAGAKAQDTAGNIYSLLASVGLSSTGTGTGSFQNDVPGAISCPVGALSVVYQAVPGWNSVYNSTAGILGRLVETRAEFETRRTESLAINSLGTSHAIRAGILALSGVLSAYVIDNQHNTPQTTGGITLPANSLYCAVKGGLATDIANVIWLKNAGGTPTFGGTSVSISDTTYPLPYPTYTINYTVPIDTPIFFAVTLRANAGLPVNIVTLVQNAIVAEFLTNNPEEIGKTVYASKYAAAVNATDVNADVTILKVGLSSPAGADFVDLNIDRYPVVTAANISVVQV